MKERESQGGLGLAGRVLEAWLRRYSRRDASVGVRMYIYRSERFRGTSAGGSHLLDLTSLHPSPGHVSNSLSLDTCIFYTDIIQSCIQLCSLAIEEVAKVHFVSGNTNF